MEQIKYQTKQINNANINIIKDIKYEKYYKLCSAGIGQIIRAIHEKQIHNIDNEHKKKLSLFFEENNQALIDSFIKIYLNTENEYDKQIRKYNLMNGKLPRKIKINEEKHNIKIGRAKMGQLIKALKQRINFIIEREIPEYYKNKEENINYMLGFKKLQQDMKEFLNEILIFESNYILLFRK